jgi:hypothetical protein
VLYNGRSYFFSLPYKTRGHPFFISQDFQEGYVVIRGKPYENILLNYDIYNQELVLKYKNLNGSYEFLSLAGVWLEGFWIHDKEFESIGYPGGEARFFQVIGKDSLKILYYWEKKLEVSRMSGDANYYLSDPVRIMYLYRDESLYRYRNNRDLVNFFDPETGIRVKDYLKKKRIKVRKASDGSIQELIRYINHLPG